MPGASDAVDLATNLTELGFAEFTTDLVLSVFNGIVASTLSQVESYSELLAAVAKTLSTYVNDTKDDVLPEELLQFVATVLGPGEDDEPKKIEAGTELSEPDATKLNGATELPTADGGLEGTNEQDNNKPAAAGTLTESAAAAILDAVARRIAANKYTFLQEMIKLGLLRLVVYDGLIETKLTFSTFGSSFYRKNNSSYQQKNFSFRANARTGGFLSRFVKASAGTKYRSVNVRTTNETQQDFTGSSVNIFGHVQVRFKTDYQPLDTQ
jgi:hypothetical protein